jgi:hypothetical protein
MAQALKHLLSPAGSQQVVAMVAAKFQQSQHSGTQVQLALSAGSARPRHDQPATHVFQAAARVVGEVRQCRPEENKPAHQKR